MITGGMRLVGWPMGEATLMSLYRDVEPGLNSSQGVLPPRTVGLRGANYNVALVNQVALDVKYFDKVRSD